MSGSEDRRDALKIIGAIGTTCAFPFSADELWGQTEAHAHAAHQLAQRQDPAAVAAPQFFTERELKLASRLADLIIPATDTPGALAAGVPLYIDTVLKDNAAQGNAFRRGLRWLDETSRHTYGSEFLTLTEEQQVSVLTPLCEAVDNNHASSDGERFFGLMKMLTADGFFTSQAGLIQTLGYKGNMVMSEFPGCVHEH